MRKWDRSSKKGDGERSKTTETRKVGFPRALKIGITHQRSRVLKGGFRDPRQEGGRGKLRVVVKKHWQSETRLGAPRPIPWKGVLLRSKVDPFEKEIGGWKPDDFR